jgi:hypothetical protein
MSIACEFRDMFAPRRGIVEMSGGIRGPIATSTLAVLASGDNVFQRCGQFTSIECVRDKVAGTFVEKTCLPVRM